MIGTYLLSTKSSQLLCKKIKLVQRKLHIELNLTVTLTIISNRHPRGHIWRINLWSLQEELIRQHLPQIKCYATPINQQIKKSSQIYHLLISLMIMDIILLNRLQISLITKFIQIIRISLRNKRKLPLNYLKVNFKSELNLYWEPLPKINQAL